MIRATHDVNPTACSRAQHNPIRTLVYILSTRQGSIQRARIIHKLDIYTPTCIPSQTLTTIIYSQFALYILSQLHALERTPKVRFTSASKSERGMTYLSPAMCSHVLLPVTQGSSSRQIRMKALHRNTNTAPTSMMYAQPTEGRRCLINRLYATHIR